MVGSFEGTIDFNAPGTPYTRSAVGGQDLFFAKYNVSGGVQYAYGIGASNGRSSAGAVAVYQDAGGNVFFYVSGTFRSSGGTATLNFNPQNSGFPVNLSTTNVSGESFVAKYNAATGGLVWVTKIPNPTTSGAVTGAITTDASGDLYYVRREPDNGPGTMRKFSGSNGALVFNNTIGGGAFDVAQRGNTLYVAGTGLGSGSQPVAWYNTSGTFLGAAGATSKSYDRIALENGGSNVYVAGNQYNSTTGTFNILLEGYSGSTFTISNTIPSGINGVSYDLAVSGSVLVMTGWFKGTVNFGGGVTLTSSGGGAHDNIFAAGFDAYGGCKWAKNNAATLSSGLSQSAPLAIGSNNTYFNIISYVQNRTVNADFCGGTSNIDFTNAGNGFYGLYRTIGINTYFTYLQTYQATATRAHVRAEIVPVVGATSYSWYIDNVLKETTYDYVWDYAAGLCGTSHTLKVVVNRPCLGPLTISSGYTVNCSGGGGGTLVSYPNPATNQLTLSLDPQFNAVSTAGESRSQSTGSVPVFKARLFNALQREVKSGESREGRLVLSVGDLPKGIYFLRVDTGTDILQKQVRIDR